MSQESKYQLDDSRRLTGANLHWDKPSAIIDVSFDATQDGSTDPGAGTDPVILAWREAAEYWLSRVGYSREKTFVRRFEGGASLLISAPIDVLYSMCELNEVAWASAVAEMTGTEPPDEAEESPRLNRLFDEERNPALLALQEAAQQHRVPFLWDDDEVSLGYGASCTSWTPDSLPSVDSLEWPRYRSIPVAMVTGTNGKSTTVRMTAAIMAAAGHRAGLTSTDFIRVGERTIDTGDYSGTGGARMLMRQHDVEMAVLEVARGGLLRRGLGLDSADVAVVTNVAADHLGDYGIYTVADLIPAKFIVGKSLGSTAPLVLNADDPGVVGYAANLDNRIHWFSLEPDNPKVLDALQMGGSACFLDDGSLFYADADGAREIVHTRDIPATLQGAALYNVANALAAVSVAVALNIDDESIRQGLADFRGDEKDNPGRGNWFEHNGIRILVDFAHNEHGMKALANTVMRIDSERITVLIGQAGDRPDEDIRSMVHAAVSVEPDQLLVTALPGYERGRELYDVPHVIREFALEVGVSDDVIEIFPSPEEATRHALQNARPGDLLVLLVLTQREQALKLVHEFLGDA